MNIVYLIHFKDDYDKIISINKSIFYGNYNLKELMVLVYLLFSQIHLINLSFVHY